MVRISTLNLEALSLIPEGLARVHEYARRTQSAGGSKADFAGIEVDVLADGEWLRRRGLRRRRPKGEERACGKQSASQLLDHGCSRISIQVPDVASVIDHEVIMRQPSSARRAEFCLCRARATRRSRTADDVRCAAPQGVEHWHEKQSKHRRRDQTANHNNRQRP